jgi:general stress protein YciG
MPSNKESIIRKRFNGDENAYREYMSNLGRKGGKKSRGGGFTGDPERARLASLKAHEIKKKAKDVQ